MHRSARNSEQKLNDAKDKSIRDVYGDILRALRSGTNPSLTVDLDGFGTKKITSPL